MVLVSVACRKVRVGVRVGGRGVVLVLRGVPEGVEVEAGEGGGRHDHLLPRDRSLIRVRIRVRVRVRVSVGVRS